MYYIRNGLGKNWKWLGVLFAIFGMLAGFGIGNTVQSNSVADVMQSTFSIPPLASGVVITVLEALVLVGGIQDRKSTRLNSSHVAISYAVFCLKKKNIGMGLCFRWLAEG